MNPTPTIQQIVEALEQVAPLSLQESYDNCGLIVGDPALPCTGALLTVDVTPEIVEEAAQKGCNLIVAHHPIIFRGLKRINDNGSLPERSVITAIRKGIAIYACHTSMDSASTGVSHEMAMMLGLTDIRPLTPNASDPTTGLGAIGRLEPAVTADRLVKMVKETFGSPVARCNEFDMSRTISSVGLCGGSGASMIADAERGGAQAYITSDTKYHDFVDHADRILLIDIGHHEGENCTKTIFYRIITEKFPIFAVRYSEFDNNPIKYL